MRNFVVLGLLMVLTCGCRHRASETCLDLLASGISEALAGPEPLRGLRLDIRAETKTDNQVILHCVLRNDSTAATDIDVDRSSLPWFNALFFEISAVTADGSVVHRNRLSAFSHIAPPAEPVTIAPGRTLEGDIKLSEIPISGLPTNKDLILLWSYGIREWHSPEQPIEALHPAQFLWFHGATFLKSG
jgi:hypothetical protein